MPVKTPAPGDLEPIERASRDELQALLARLGGMQARLAELVVGMRQASTSVAGASSEIAAGVTPDTRDAWPSV